MFFSIVHAISNIKNPVLNTTLQAQNGESFTNGLLSASINLFLIVGALTFFFMLLWGGLQWIQSGGDKGKTEVARDTITKALIGIVLLFSAWAFLNFMESFLGTNLTTFDWNLVRIK